MYKRNVLTLMFIVALLAAICDALPIANSPDSEDLLTFAPAIAMSFLIFIWVRMDANERQFRRSPLLNLGVLLLAPLAVPIYLVRSRPAGSRLKAFGWFLVCLAAFLAVSLVGSWIGSLFAGVVA